MDPGLENLTRFEEGLVVFAVTLSGNHYCWNSGARATGNEFEVLYYGQGNCNHFAPAFPSFLLRLVVEELNSPIADYSLRDWRSNSGWRWREIVDLTCSVFGLFELTKDLVPRLREIMGREMQSGISVFTPSELEEFEEMFY